MACVRVRISVAISFNSGFIAMAIPERWRSILTIIRQDATSPSCAPPMDVKTRIRASHFSYASFSVYVKSPFRKLSAACSA